MSIFKKGKSTVVLKKITGLQQQLKVIEKQAVDKELQIEEAVSNGSSTDKLFEQVGQLRGNIEARRSILAKMEAELRAALAQEDRVVRLAELARFEGQLEKGFSSLDSKFKDFVAAGKELLEKEALLGSEYRNLCPSRR
ncbi:MAG: hypothetical protein FVQ80_14045 [Planctomycetes bacterium]|nr:hypothetical protein [Planctomycetota bacterium]